MTPRRRAVAPARSGDGRDAENEPRSDTVSGLLRVGVVAFFVAACTFGSLEVHSSTDTWIGLAAGRHIVTSREFPIADSFSYTFAGATWFNQNWLSHVLFWLVYSHLGRTELVIATWALDVGIFALVLLATRLRSGSWFAATLAASVVAVASRDWLSIRPATVQFVLLAALWLALSALVAEGGRQRWWPVGVLAVVLGVWPHAHGSFLFGYGLVALWVGCAVAPRLLRRPCSSSGSQILAVVAVVVGTAILGVRLSPFGVDNYLHPFKVAESKVFRQVGEWLPPVVPGSYPPVLRFWLAVGIAASSAMAALVLRRAGARTPQGKPSRRVVPGGGEPMDRVLFDLAAIALGLALALWARRFAPFFYILATPALVTAVIRWAEPVSQKTRRTVRVVLSIAAWCAALATGAVAAARAHSDLVGRVSRSDHGRPDLLDRVTRLYQSPLDAFRFLDRNHLRANVLTEWKQAGPLVFLAPDSRVFIDGRSQQVYDERHFLRYQLLVAVPEGRREEALAILAASGTDLAVLPRWSSLKPLFSLLATSSDWPYLFEETYGVVYVRRGSPLLAELGRRDRAAALWWPEQPSAYGGRGTLRVITEPHDLPEAITLWRTAVEQQPSLGIRFYQPIADAFASLGRVEEGLEWLRSERSRLAAAVGLAPGERDTLLQAISRCETRLRAVGAHAPAAPPVTGQAPGPRRR